MHLKGERAVDVENRDLEALFVEGRTTAVEGHFGPEVKTDDALVGHDQRRAGPRGSSLCLLQRYFENTTSAQESGR